jgi:microcystin-dependent protein
VSEPFLGEVKLISWNYPPKGWALCNGQLLPINQNQALFALFGTMYGGDGRVTFALPDLRGRVSIHKGNGFTQGQVGGEQAHTVTMAEMAAHTHLVTADTATGTASPTGTSRFAASSSQALYAPPNNLVGMDPNVIGTAGGSQPHQNMQPYLCINFIVALQGIFPSQN